MKRAFEHALMVVGILALGYIVVNIAAAVYLVTTLRNSGGW